MSASNDKNEPNQSNGLGEADLQIVGGGLAGLIAANLALDAGLSVRLIEAKRSLGGRAGSTNRDGFTLNHGPHALYVSGQMLATLQSLGIDPVGALPNTKGATGSIGSTTGLLPGGPASLLRTSLLPGRGKRHLLKLMARLPRLDTAPLDSTTVAQWLEDTTDVPELQQLLTGLINLSTYCFAPNMLSAGAALAQLKMAMDANVLYLDGGWATIVDALNSRLQAHQANADGRFERVEAKVTAIEMESQAATTRQGSDSWPMYTCRAADEAYRSATVLLASGSPAVADRLIGGGTGLVEAAGPPVEAAALDLGLRSTPKAPVHLGLDTGLYLSTHSVAKRLAPSGQTLVSVARYLRPGGEHDLPADETRALLLSHARAAGIDQDDIVMDRYLHRLTVTHGMPLAERGGLAGRPPVAVAERPGMFIAGDWVGPAGLLADASAASAATAVQASAASAKATRRVRAVATGQAISTAHATPTVETRPDDGSLVEPAPIRS